MTANSSQGGCSDEKWTYSDEFQHHKRADRSLLVCSRVGRNGTCFCDTNIGDNIVLPANSSQGGCSDEKWTYSDEFQHHKRTDRSLLVCSIVGRNGT
jgi:hypothetical protein